MSSYLIIYHDKSNIRLSKGSFVLNILHILTILHVIYAKTKRYINFIFLGRIVMSFDILKCLIAYASKISPKII